MMKKMLFIRMFGLYLESRYWIRMYCFRNVYWKKIMKISCILKDFVKVMKENKKERNKVIFLFYIIFIYLGIDLMIKIIRYFL